MIDKSFIFLGGHHRSGTSLLHAIIRKHPLVSGFSKTGVPGNEGQHLQSVYKAAKAFGGPGKYIFDKNSYMDEHHDLAKEQSAKTIMEQWGKHYDPKCTHFIEKSPPNIIRTRFLQKLFPNSKFIIILRHPIAVAYATQKWSKTSIKSLVDHSLRGYEIFLEDMPHLRHVYVIRYEDFVCNPQEEINKIYKFLCLEEIPIQDEVHSNINNKYFSMWHENRNSFFKRLLFPVNNELERRANRFGYSIKNCENMVSVSVLGAHDNKIQPTA